MSTMFYEPTIGLEIHAALKTQTKMFCDSKNDPDEKHPNTNVCPVCLGHPGTLPTINKQAVEHIVRIGLALGGKIAEVSKFDRKNYFYPDLPKGYQISQYDQPIVSGGELFGVRIWRVHLEEDAGRLLHAEDISQRQRTSDLPHRNSDDADNENENASFVDFNRAGVPLMELVTEPDIHSAEQAARFAKEFQKILQYLGVSDANMEKGEMRVEVNISLSPNFEFRISNESGEKPKLGTKVEVKNINSFRAAADAITYEIKRQTELLESGRDKEIVQETRGWDDIKKITVSQRSKEEAHDYRYFPEPDLPPFEPAKIFDLEKMKLELPELPIAKRERFAREFGLTEGQAALLTENKPLADYFEAAISELAARDEQNTSETDKRAEQILVNYLTGELAGIMNQEGIKLDDIKVRPEQLAQLSDLVCDKKITTVQAKEILNKMFETGDDPEEIMGRGNFGLIGEEILYKAIGEALLENQAAVADFNSGKLQAIQFLVGKVMQKTRGAVDSGDIQNKLLEKIRG